MDNIVFAVARHLLILVAVLTLLNLSTAEEPESEPGRFAIIFQPAEADPKTDEYAPLLCALQRNGYRDAVSGDLGATLVIATRNPVRRAINEVREHALKGATVVFYYGGPLRCDGESMLIRDSAKPISLEFLIDKLLGLNDDELKKQLKPMATVAFLLDAESENSLEELKEAVAHVQQIFPINLHVLIGQRKPGSGSCPTQMIRDLRQVLTYNREADRDDDGAVSVAELDGFLRESLQDAYDVASIAPSEGGASMPIAWLHPSCLDDAIDDISNEIALAIRDSGATAAVVRDFTEPDRATASQGSLGPLVPYITHQVRRRVGRALEGDQISLHSAEDVEPGTEKIADATGSIRVDLKATPVQLTMSGKVTINEDAGPSETSVLREVNALLNVDETAMSGHVNMSPKAAMAAGIQWAIDDLDASPDTATHPMADADFPLRVYLESEDGTPLECWFSPDNRCMYVDVQEGDQYAIVVENRTDQDLFLRLLVDGRNTLPDCADDEEVYEPAQYVSLTRARCWFCEAGETYRIAGFYTQIDEEVSATDTTGQWQAFRVTDVGNVLPEENYWGQLGIITAAFYEAVAKANSSMAFQPRFATCPGSAGSGTLNVYGGELGPGALIGEAPINIRYGFRTDGDQ